MGFFMVDNEVVDQMEFINAHEFAIYIIISRYSNNGKMSFPSIELIRNKLHCSKRKITEATTTLEKKGYINVFRTKGKSNRYMLGGFGVKPAISTRDTTVSEEEHYKEQYIKNKNKETFSTGEEDRAVILKK
ncbi:MAG: helix-turn-helix domain-containing protein, partial [Fusobacteriaceae bacterium]